MRASATVAATALARGVVRDAARVWVRDGGTTAARHSMALVTSRNSAMTSERRIGPRSKAASIPIEGKPFEASRGKEVI